MIIGTTREETSLLIIWSRLPADEAGYRKTLTDDFGDLADAIAKAYPVRDPKEIRAAVIRLGSDVSFAHEARAIARWHSSAGRQTFRYQFSLGSDRGFLRGLGAHHGADVPFLFQRVVGESERRMGISRTIGRYWINFAATGNPNGQGLPTWPAYRADDDEMVDFGEGVSVLKGYRNSELDVIENALGRTSGIAPQSLLLDRNPG
jgi:para-nitrobenzyl esterase